MERTWRHAKEWRRGQVLGRVKRGEWKLSEAARMLAISDRQRKRIGRRYSAGGTKALQHGNVGRISNRAKPAEVRKRVLQLVRAPYSGEPRERFGPALAAEHLWADHDLQVSVRTLRRRMLAAGLWSRRRKRQAHRQRRQRKAHVGELIQAGGSHHPWREGIADYEAANRYLEERYLPEHNAKFACESTAEADFHQRPPKRLDLKWVFCLEAEERFPPPSHSPLEIANAIPTFPQPRRRRYSSTNQRTFLLGYRRGHFYWALTGQLFVLTLKGSYV